MIRKYFRCSSLGLIALFVIMLFCCGCETWKGLQKDWATLTKWDKEFQEKYW